MLWKSEAKKLLVTQKGALILAVCLVLKALFLLAFPELKDARLQMSQRQYDKCLARVYGEAAPEKLQLVREEYQRGLEAIAKETEMKSLHSQGGLTEEEWEAYTAELENAYLYQNAWEILAEKTNQMEKQQAWSQDLPAAHYIYEFGWETIYTLQCFPDVFLLAGLLLLAVQSLSMESASGMLPVLLAARDGRRRLYLTKQGVLLGAALAGCLLSGGMELAIFSAKGWCNDWAAPLYSVTSMAGCALPLSLGEAYLTALLCRGLAAVLFTGAALGLSVWIRRAQDMVFTSVCLLGLPLLWGGPEALFTHGGLLCGSLALQWLAQLGLPLWVPLCGMAGGSLGLALLGGWRFCRGV